jgi:hypothetical protein
MELVRAWSPPKYRNSSICDILLPRVQITYGPHQDKGTRETVNKVAKVDNDVVTATPNSSGGPQYFRE